MKQNWFSVRLYREGLRQLRLIGILGLVILGLEAILIPVGRVLSIRDMRYFQGKEMLGFPGMHPLLVLCFCAFAPLMVLYLFRFLNKRNASDFYHAIPETRLCLFLSFFAAVVTWILVILVFTSFLSVTVFLCFPAYFSINMTSVLVVCLNVFAGSLLVAASVAVAMCVTGTIFTNIVVSLMIIFIPRLLILLLITSVTSNLPLVSSDNFIPLLDIGYNVPVGTVLMLGSGESLTNWRSGVYTLVLGLLYAACAALLFRARKSEAAGQAAPNRILQAVYRLVLSMVVCALACYYIFRDLIWQSQNASYQMNTYTYVVMYIVALGVFFLYELITTRKWKNLIRSIPSLLVLVLLNVALIGGMTGLYRSVLSFTPSAGDISSVRLLSGGTRGSYFAARTSHIDITDENVRSIISRQLSSAVRVLERSREEYYRYTSSKTTIRVAIRTRGVTHVREIPMRAEDLEALAKPLAEIDEYRAVYQQLPRIDAQTTTVTLNRSSFVDIDVREVYEALCEEVAAMPFEEWYLLVVAQNREESYPYSYVSSDMMQTELPPSLDVFQVWTAVGADQYSFSIPLYTSLEKTCNLYLRQYRESSEHMRNQEAILQALRENNWTSGDSLTVRGYGIYSVMDTWYGTTLYPDVLATAPDPAAAFADGLEKHLGEDLNITEPLYYLALQDYNPYDSSYTEYAAYFRADSRQIAELLTMSDSTDYGYGVVVSNDAVSYE